MCYHFQFMLIVLFISGFDCQINFPRQTSEACSTQKGQPGTCISLRTCKYIVDLIQAQPTPALQSKVYRETVQPDLCRFVGKEAYVCCSNHVDVSARENEEVTRQEFDRKRQQFEVAANAPGPCGYESSFRIVGGTIARIDQFPWAVQLYYTTSDGRVKPQCGGALINADHVVTAAHCVDKSSLQRSGTELSFVRLGEWNTSSQTDCYQNVCSDPTIDMPIQSIKPHNKYTKQSKSDDIALIRLVRKVAEYTSFIRAICLPFADHLKDMSYSNLELTVTGWGWVTQNDTFGASKGSDVKLYVNLPAVSKEECSAVYQREANILISDLQLCAGGKANHDSCRGDSGGPLMKYDNTNFQNQYWFLAGVVSFGPSVCGTENFPGVYTRIDKYLDWILENIVY